VDSAVEFADRVVELWSDHARRLAMGAAARETVRTERSQARTTAELEQILR
jgi:glycosyltransferase involved in cell wall biosynthesis